MGFRTGTLEDVEMTTNIDFLIIGAGIVGLTIAREISIRLPKASIIIAEKEPNAGMHSSGRNSGVLHSGIYYPSDSFKARVCSAGAKEMADFCIQHGLPFRRIGKILVPTREEDDIQMTVLEKRAVDNGIAVKQLDEKELQEMEPEVRSATGKGLWIPSTSVASPASVMQAILTETINRDVSIRYSALITSVNAREKKAQKNDQPNQSYGDFIHWRPPDAHFSGDRQSGSGTAGNSSGSGRRESGSRGAGSWG